MAEKIKSKIYKLAEAQTSFRADDGNFDAQLEQAKKLSRISNISIDIDKKKNRFLRYTYEDQAYMAQISPKNKGIILNTVTTYLSQEPETAGKLLEKIEPIIPENKDFENMFLALYRLANRDSGKYSSGVKSPAFQRKSIFK